MKRYGTPQQQMAMARLQAQKFARAPMRLLTGAQNHGGMRIMQHPGLGNVAYPGMSIPGPMPSGMVYQDQIASLGAAAGVQVAAEDDPRYAQFNKIPAFYVINITLGGVANDTMTGTVTLRPEPFILKRITWATTGDTYPAVDQEPGYSLQGRAVTMKWGDEFTKLFGNTSSLVAAAMGDSNGFLDIIKGALFQGSQTLDMNLTRLHWPANTTAISTRWDFVFSGLALLPPNVNQSGSAG